MGCESSKEDLEARMLMLKMKRLAIRQQRKKKKEKLEQLTGEKIILEPIPDYLEDTDDNIATNKENEKIGQKENLFNKKNDFDIDDDENN